MGQNVKREQLQKVRRVNGEPSWSQEGPLHEEGESREEKSNTEEHSGHTAWIFCSGSNLK